jgi:hypothetical protein
MSVRAHHHVDTMEVPLERARDLGDERSTKELLEPRDLLFSVRLDSLGRVEVAERNV